MRVLTALIVWVAAVVGAVLLSGAVAGSIHKQSAGSSASVSGSSGGGSAGPDPSSITATDRLSLFRTANLERALARARTALGSRAQVDNFALYPGYLSITAVKGSGEVDFYVDANGRVIQTSTGGTPGGSSLFRLFQVSPGVPVALAHRIATAGHVPEAQLHYMVVDVDSESNRLEWLVYPLQGNRVEYFKAAGATGQLLEYRANSSTGPQPVSG